LITILFREPRKRIRQHDRDNSNRSAGSIGIDRARRIALCNPDIDEKVP
jgi:hypothetical protein